jgi:hypothetical protein
VPFIPYPSIPNIPGIGLPQLPQPPNGVIALVNAGSGILGALDGADSVSLDNTPTWGITDTNGNPLLQPDSFIDLEFRADMKIPTYPIEGGSFQSYNKVLMPYDARLTVACNGNGPQLRSDFLPAVEKLRLSLTLINLVHYDYRREARQGVTLLLVQLWFQKVIVSVQGATQTAQPDGQDPQNNGQVSPVAPTPTQSASYLRSYNPEDSFSSDAVETVTDG